MKLFDFFIKKTDIQTLYFKNGQLFKINGNKKNWYDPKYVVSDGKMFDLSNPDQVKELPVPNFGITNVFGKYGATGMLDYVLRMKAGHCYSRNEKELCSALLWKSTEMMQQNSLSSWKRNDYIRLITWHYQLGMKEEAEKARKYLESRIKNYEDNFDRLAIQNKNSVIKTCNNINSDLIVFNHYGSGCCEECDKLSGRVYSLTGKSKTFPVIPEYALKNGNFHHGCRCLMSVYVGGDIYYRGIEVDAIKATMRPHVDGRTKREKEAYLLYLQKVEDDKQKERRAIEFYQLQDLFPDIVPKSLSAYSRMKSSNSKKYLELKEKAFEYGIYI